MISICIPTYNYDVTRLVTEIANQCDEERTRYEILIIEDGSNHSFAKANSLLSKIPNVTHIFQEENKGRSATRNRLAEIAQFNNILFIDCDSVPEKSDYIKKYKKHSDKAIVCGGTAYNKSQNIKGHELRYKYGIKREAVKSSKRNKKPNDSFATNNFMISKSVISKIKFRESIKSYGHEDTVLGFDLDNSNYKIEHIDNPIIHLGIESNEVSLKKTEISVLNLVKIESANIIDKSYLYRIKLIKMFNLLTKFRLVKLFFSTSELFRIKMRKHLINSKNPKLLIFDLYKLNFYCKNKLIKQDS